jgi:hypothetical protein
VLENARGTEAVVMVVVLVVLVVVVVVVAVRDDHKGEYYGI